jgi:geranylgeranyl reductase family protein
MPTPGNADTPGSADTAGGADTAGNADTPGSADTAGGADTAGNAPAPGSADPRGSADRAPEANIDDECDIAVIGAGPAGATAALAALQTWPEARVVLLDRVDFPRDKTCGDGLAAQVLDVLAEVGEPTLLDDWPRVHRLRLGFPDGAGVARAMARPTLVVPREVLDARLVAAAVKRGAVMRQHRVRQVRPLVAEGGARPGGATVDGALRARVVIGADGAHSAVRASLGLPAPRPGTTAIALRGYARVHPTREEEQVIAFAGHAAWPAYAWSFPIGDGRANVGYGEALPVDGPGPSRARMLARLEELLPGSTDGVRGLKAYHLPLSTGRVRQPDGPVLLTGDALGLVNPLTGEGIHAAVRSGAVAGAVAARTARAGAGDRAGQDYRRRLAGALGAHLRHMDLVARLAADPRVVRAGLEVSASDRRVFDALVDLGLADGVLTPHLVLALVRRAGGGGLVETLRSVRPRPRPRRG